MGKEFSKKSIILSKKSIIFGRAANQFPKYLLKKRKNIE